MTAISNTKNFTSLQQLLKLPLFALATCSLLASAGCSGSGSTPVTPALKNPVANAGGSYTALPGATVSFSGAASSDPQGSALSYAWDFGDSTKGTGVAPTHSYTSVGNYNVSLTVMDALGLNGSAVVTASVAAQAPAANAGGPYSTSVGSPVVFDGTGSRDPQGQVLSYAWDFGDGTVGTGAQPSHFYATHGSYTATLTVTDATYNLAGKTTVAVTNTQASIQPMTNVIVGGTGYFSDPYPIQTTVSNGSPVPSFVGTTKQILTCPAALQARCFTSAPNTVDAGTLAAQASAAGASITGYENLNSYQDSKGNWQMAVTALVQGPNNNWSVIVHAHPVIPYAGVPTAWSADALLVGSFAHYDHDDYDGKYFEDSGVLYLLYNKKLTVTNATTGEDGIVAQAMQSASVPATSNPVPLLGPEDSNGGYNSELSAGTVGVNAVKLMETGNVTKIQGKYAIAYSTGFYNNLNYKAGVAWSDTFLPAPGTYYKRVQKIDTAGVWGVTGHPEVAYLLQTQQPQWPNYVTGQVLAAGVPSIVADTGGNYHLFFAGYDPNDAPLTSAGAFEGSRRRPYYVDLKVNIPGGASVSSASAIDMASWLQLVTAP